MDTEILQVCQGQTRNGAACRNHAITGAFYCRHHLATDEPAWQILDLTRDIPVLAQREIDVLAQALCKAKHWEVVAPDVSAGSTPYVQVSFALDRQYAISAEAEGQDAIRPLQTAVARAQTGDPLIGVQLAYALMAWLLEAEVGKATVDIDAVVALLGLPWRNSAEKLACRKVVVAWLSPVSPRP